MIERKCPFCPACCCCLILLLRGEFGLNTQYLLLEVNWLGICNCFCCCFIFYFSLHLLVVVCCDTVVSIYSAYCLLLFVYWFVLLCLIWRQKQNLLNICLCMYLWPVCVCGKRKNASLTNERSNWTGKLQMLNTTSSFVCVCTLNCTLYCCFAFDQCYSLRVFVIQRVVCLCGFYVLSLCFSLHLHIMISVCVC